MVIGRFGECLDSMKEWTSVAVRKDTHRELTARGSKDDSYDDIIRRLLGLNKVTKSEEKDH